MLLAALNSWQYGKNETAIIFAYLALAASSVVTVTPSQIPTG
jgi:hypothetical protein